VDAGDGLGGPDRIEGAHVGMQNGPQHLLLGIGPRDRREDRRKADRGMQQ
jgi:hypothetical protein